jgi:prophage regulatory protein
MEGHLSHERNTMTDVKSARLLTFADVQERTTLGKKTIARLISSGGFPAPVRPSPGRVAFYEVEVDAFIASRGRA